MALIEHAKSTVAALAFILLFLQGSQASAREIVATSSRLAQVQAFNFDFDDNIFVTGAKIMIWDNVRHKEYAVSTANWALIKDRIGKDGPLKNFSLRPDGLRYFSDTSADGDDLFKKQVEQALASGDDSWKAPSWNAFVDAMSRPETRKHTTIITARLHSPTAIMKGLQVLKDRGLIKALPDLANIYSVGWPDLDSRFKGENPAESKAKVMTYELDQVEAQSVPENAKWVENRTGDGKEKLHLWGFSDDDFGNFSKALSVLSPEVASGRWPHVKLVLFYTGLNNPEQRPHAVVIRPDGTIRAALPREAKRPETLTHLMSPDEAQHALDALIDSLYRPST